MKTMTKRLLLVPMAAALALSLSACDKSSDEGPAEQMGRKIDNAAEHAGDAMRDAKSSMSQATERAGEKLESMGDKAEQKTD